MMAKFFALIAFSSFFCSLAMDNIVNRVAKKLIDDELASELLFNIERQKIARLEKAKKMWKTATKGLPKK